MLLKEWVEKSVLLLELAEREVGLTIERSNGFLYTTAFLRYLVSLGEFKRATVLLWGATCALPLLGLRHRVLLRFATAAEGC